jgi:HisA/HisF family protein
MPNRFSIIPVLDLKAGRIVHARAGDRARYLPIRTPLAKTSEPSDVLAGLLSLAPFHRLYIADLDAIEGRANNTDAITRLARLHPTLEIWVDSGLTSAEAAIDAAGPTIVPVLGSESLPDPAILAAVRAGLGNGRCALSLDYRGGEFMGSTALETEPSLWPDNIIVMSLARVGTDLGPDFARLALINAKAGNRSVWAAGGVRGPGDLEKLAAMGLAGALVASALHDGRLAPKALAAFA